MKSRKDVADKIRERELHIEDLTAQIAENQSERSSNMIRTLAIKRHEEALSILQWVLED